MFLSTFNSLLSTALTGKGFSLPHSGSLFAYLVSRELYLALKTKHSKLKIQNSKLFSTSLCSLRPLWLENQCQLVLRSEATSQSSIRV